MGIFRKGESLLQRGQEGLRYRIRIETVDGDELFWHKRGQIHLVDEDVARAFVENFKPDVFEVLPDGSFTPPQPGKTTRVARLTMEPAPLE